MFLSIRTGMNRVRVRFVVSHPFARKNAKGWGTEILFGALAVPHFRRNSYSYFFSTAAVGVAPSFAVADALSLLNSVIISRGSGKTMVVFFSTPISVSVCR